MNNRNEYTEHRSKVARTARWGTVGAFGPLTTDVWVILHGYGQLAADFATSSTWPVESGRSFVFPEALQRFYIAEPNSTHSTAPVGASWMTRDARLDDIADNHAYLDAVAEEILTRSPRARFGAIGFSQGGATAVRWGAERALAGRPLAQVVLWGGSMPPEIDIGPGAPLRASRLTIVCGTRDRWLPPERIAGERARLDAAGFRYRFVGFDGGHRLDDATIKEVVSVL